MQVRHERLGRFDVVAVEGDVDVSNALELREVLGSSITSGSMVLVDMSAVPFLDSSGIGIFVAAHRRAEQLEGTFALVAPTQEVSQVLSMTRTDRLLRVYSSTQAAQAALGTGE
jgi:anti-sigma B factor antagonist